MVLVIGVLNRRLMLRDFWQSLLDTGYITSSILLILVAAQIYSRMLTIGTVPNFICDIGVSLSLPPILTIVFFLSVGLGENKGNLRTDPQLRHSGYRRNGGRIRTYLRDFTPPVGPVHGKSPECRQGGQSSLQRRRWLRPA
jgi:hypothetical protein